LLAMRLPMIGFVFVMGAWGLFFAVLVVRRLLAPKRPTQSKRGSASRWAILLQAASVWPMFAFQRQPLASFPDVPLLFRGVLIFAEMAIAIFSVWLSVAAVQMLGKQWSYSARIVEGHQLVMSGPYRLVRNPIYLGLFGLLLATAIAASRWWAACIAIVVFLLANWIRIRSEERSLRATFGQQFEDFARRVPALFPGIW
jgi:protein-S-isoprenylcysteine O-methyltransferase Ste14